MVTVHVVPATVSHPLQPIKIDRVAGAAVRVTLVPPFPSWPKPLSAPPAPQHFTELPDRSAQLCRHHPPVTAMAPVSSPTLTGVIELVVVPLPSCPSRFRPQHCTVPSPSSALVCCHPAVTAMAPVMPPTRTGVVETSPAVLVPRSEEHTSELQSQSNLVCRLLLEKKK